MAKHTARTRKRPGISLLVWLVLYIEWSLLKVTKSVCSVLCVRDDNTYCGQQVRKCAAQRYTSGAFAPLLSLSSFLRVSATVCSAWRTYSVLYSTVTFTSAVVLDKHTHSNLVHYKHNGDDEPYDYGYITYPLGVIYPQFKTADINIKWQWLWNTISVRLRHITLQDNTQVYRYCCRRRLRFCCYCRRH